MSSFHGGLPGEGGAVEEGLFSLGPGALTGSVFTGDTLLVIRAPSGTRLEVPVPEVSDKGLHGLCVCVCVCVCMHVCFACGKLIYYLKTAFNMCLCFAFDFLRA